MNLSIEEKMDLVRQMRNSSLMGTTDKKKEQKKNSVAFFFMRLSSCIAIGGLLYVAVLKSDSARELVYTFFTGETTVNLIDFFAPFKYTFKGL